MSAQPGDAILLAYGPQGAQQDGDAILLAYGAAAASVTVRASIGMPWAQSRPVAVGLRVPFDQSVALDRASRARWGSGVSVDLGQRAVWGLAAAVDRAQRAAWGRYERALQRECLIVWSLARAEDRVTASPWARRGLAAQPQSVLRWASARARDDSTVIPWGGPMAVRDIELTARMPRPAPGDLQRTIPWTRYSRPLQPGWGIPTPPTPGPVPGETTVIPSRRSYSVINEIHLLRVSDNAVIPARSMSIQIEDGSTMWRFSASVPASALALVQPTAGVPVELEATVNGYAWRMLVTGLGRDRQFGSGWLRVEGRGLTATLAAPFAASRSIVVDEARTAAQLADLVLTDNGVPIGWTVDWGITDWLVPGWVFNGTYIDGLSAIASAAGAYLLPDPVLQEIKVLPSYPVPPWEWGDVTPDVELPVSVVTREGIEWSDRPGYNGVYVMGTTAGVQALVKRTGTAADVQAQPVVDALITHADAARQRGTAILSDTGRRADVSLRLPVLEETGVVGRGNFVRYVDGSDSLLGIVRSVQIEATHGAAWQIIGVETHE